MPLAEDVLEDWVRLPADRAEVRARVLRMLELAAEAPTLEDTGLVRYRDKVLQFPPTEARLMAVLIGAFASVVDPETLLTAGWPDETPPRNTLDVHISRIRRRLTGAGLALRTIRSRGYMLEPTTSELAD